MAYATIGNILTRFKPIGSMIGTGSSDVTSDEISSSYIPDAQSFIDAYLANRYSVPVAPVTPLLTQLCSDLTIFNLLAEKSGNIPEWMDKRYERCIKTLELLRDGEMVLNSATVIGSAGDNFAWSTSQGYHSIFSPVVPDLDQVADLDRVNADLDERANDTGVNS